MSDKIINFPDLNKELKETNYSTSRDGTGIGVITSRMTLEKVNKIMAGLRIIKAIVDEQAEDAGLWFLDETASEAYLQMELRRLHAAIEALEDEY